MDELNLIREELLENCDVIDLDTQDLPRLINNLIRIKKIIEFCALINFILENQRIKDSLPTKEIP
jgi:hypothetical protein